MDKGRSLTRSEFDAVIRRAAELATSDTESAEGGLTEDELFRIANEVGLSERHVRAALSDVRGGVGQGGFLERIFGPSHVRAARVVPQGSDELADSIDDFLAGTQLLQRVRRTPTMLQYRPAVDWASQLARAASFSSRKYYVASARSVEVQLQAVEDGRTHVELLVDPGTRGDDAAGALFGGGFAGLACGGLAGWGVAAIAPLALGVAAGALVGVGTWSGITYAIGMAHKRKVAAVQNEVEGVLDALESGGSLEPPPPSWRRWVKRYFHGMATEFDWGGAGRWDR
ncbi:MAG TPA: hypothetical protein VMM35_00675 [Longimicrobiales bacterium]|nr:hypothetical protein [Longimicrobiales bacterium]